MPLNNADRMANKEDPDQDVPLKRSTWLARDYLSKNLDNNGCLSIKNN